MHKRVIANLEIDLPGYMKPLEQSVLDLISECSEKGDRIISCGVIEDCLRFVTGSGQVREICKNGRLLPVSATPIDEGRNVALEFPGGEIRKVTSRLIIKYSKNCLNKPELFVNNSYVCDAEFDNYEFSTEAQ